MIQLFRVLLPSWKFFDGVVEAPELFYRVSLEDESHFGEWILCIPKTKARSWKKLWINSQENFLFASHALLEYLKNDLRDGSDPSVSLELVKNLTQYQIKASSAPARQFQFMLASIPKESEADYISPVMELGA